MRTLMTLRTRDQKKSRRKLLQEHNTLTSEAAGKNDEHSSRGNGSTQLARVDLSGSSSFDGEELRNSLRHYTPLQQELETLFQKKRYTLQQLHWE